MFVSFPANLEGRVKEGRMTQEHYKKACTLLKGVLSYDNFKDVDLVIEVGCCSIFEKHYTGSLDQFKDILHYPFFLS